LDGQGFEVPDTHHSLVLQSVHSPPFAPLYPRSHTHAVIACDPGGLCECAGHVWQVLESPAPCAPLYVLFGHGAQDSAVAWLSPVE